MRLYQSRLHRFLLKIMKISEGVPVKGSFDFTFLAIPRLPRIGELGILPVVDFQKPLTPFPFCWHILFLGAIIPAPLFQ